MERKLRGHHLLCVHGFRGMGYSPSFIEKMAEIVRDIQDRNQDFPVKVVVDLDDACGACPHKGNGICINKDDSNEHVISMDNKVLGQLNLKADHCYSKNDLVRLTAQRIHPEDLDYLCKGCSWLSYGVCKEGIEMLRKQYGNES